MGSSLARLTREAKTRYAAGRPKSLKANEQALRWLPGGDTRNAVWWAPFPTRVARGDGAELTDIDGLSYLDFCNNATSVVLGHADEGLASALSEASLQSVAPGMPTESATVAAELLGRRFPAAERVRFTNSGTESVLLATRLARHVTGRGLVLAFEGGFHGALDSYLRATAARTHRPILIPEHRLIVAPYNDIDHLPEIATRWGRDLAAVVVEPTQGHSGVIPAGAEFLGRLDALRQDTGALLVLDEIQTSRVGPGGAQAEAGLSPDLFVISKTYSGGMPVGVLAGLREHMCALDPDRNEALPHSGTYTANAVAMSAITHLLRRLDADAFDRLNATAEYAQARFQEVLDGSVGGSTTRTGSILGVHPGLGPVTTVRDYPPRYRELQATVHLELLDRGIYTMRFGQWCPSLATTREHVDVAAEALEAVLERLQPAVHEVVGTDGKSRREVRP